MTLRKPCEHGRYDAHSFVVTTEDQADHFRTRNLSCPGGDVLPEDVLVIEKVEAERIIARAIAGYHMTVGDAVDAAGIIVGALADQVGEPETTDETRHAR